MVRPFASIFHWSRGSGAGVGGSVGFLEVDLFEELNFLSLASFLVDEAFLSRSPSRLLKVMRRSSLLLSSERWSNVRSSLLESLRRRWFLQVARKEGSLSAKTRPNSEREQVRSARWLNRTWNSSGSPSQILSRSWVLIWGWLFFQGSPCCRSSP